mgnify:CR=1 FL=1
MVKTSKSSAELGRHLPLKRGLCRLCPIGERFRCRPAMPPHRAAWSDARLQDRALSEYAWNVAQGRLGTQVATAALVLVCEKHSAGEIAEPGGRRRGMVEKVGAGGGSRA